MTATAQLSAEETAVARIHQLHKPWRIYTDCDCRPGHTDEDVDAGLAKAIWEVGNVCEDGFMYEVCRECCTDGGAAGEGYQTEDCATDHPHGADEPICATAAILKEEGL